MLTEQCVACGAEVPLSAAVHMLVNPKEDDGDVADGYVCRSCYEEHLRPILPDDEEDPLDVASDEDERLDATGDDGPGEAAGGDDGEAADDATPGEV